jgi:hypothetical protein
MDSLPPGISLARARVLRELFTERHPWIATVRRGDIISYGRVWAASAEEAGHRAAIAGEVISIERAD